MMGSAPCTMHCWVAVTNKGISPYLIRESQFHSLGCQFTAATELGRKDSGHKEARVRGVVNPW